MQKKKKKKNPKEFDFHFLIELDMNTMLICKICPLHIEILNFFGV